MASPRRTRLAAVPDYSEPMDPDAAAAAQRWLDNAEDAWLACRGNHNFPKVRLVNGALPPGVRAERQADRSYEITETCPDCGAKRMHSTVPGGWLGGLVQHYDYDWPEGYRMPPGASEYVSIQDCKAEAWRRVEEVLETTFKAAQVKQPSRKARKPRTSGGK